MLTTWLPVLTVFSLLIALSALVLAYLAVRFALYRTGSHASAAKFAELEAELTNQASAIDAVRSALTKIRARLNAQSRVNGKNAPAGSQHDLNTQEGRDAARVELERSLTAAGKLNPRIHQRG